MPAKVGEQGPQRTFSPLSSVGTAPYIQVVADNLSPDLDADPWLPPAPPHVLTQGLAERFDMTLAEFVDLAGGGWRQVRSATLQEDFPLRWYGAGEPLQVLLGLDRSLVVVGTPEETLPGLVGPGRLRAVDIVSIETTAEGWRNALRDAVAWAVERSRRDVYWCHGCRTMTHACAVLGYKAAYCPACQEQYLGIIGC